jgi:hypothetical protein
MNRREEQEGGNEWFDLNIWWNLKILRGRGPLKTSQKAPDARHAKTE